MPSGFVALMALCVVMLLIGVWIGWEAWGKPLKRHQRDISSAGRYERACLDVLTWCGEAEFRAERRVAAQIMAIVEGSGLNAGTPCGDEPCTIGGLREQLRQIHRETPNAELTGRRPT